MTQENIIHIRQIACLYHCWNTSSIPQIFHLTMKLYLVDILQFQFEDQTSEIKDQFQVDERDQILNVYCWLELVSFSISNKLWIS